MHIFHRGILDVVHAGGSKGRAGLMTSRCSGGGGDLGGLVSPLSGTAVRRFVTIASVLLLHLLLIRLVAVDRIAGRKSAGSNLTQFMLVPGAPAAIAIRDVAPLPLVPSAPAVAAPEIDFAGSDNADAPRSEAASSEAYVPPRPDMGRRTRLRHFLRT